MEKITANNWVVNVVRFGYKMPFKFKPIQLKIPYNPKSSPEAFSVLQEEAFGLFEKGAIKKVLKESGQFISSYFAVPKPRSSKWRLILNLKKFNFNVKHYSFKMENFAKVREWIQPNFYVVSLDLKDQFLSVPIAKKFRKFLHFQWLGDLLEWQVLPFGLKYSPRVVTKLLKPVLALLRSNFGILISVYMDDLILQANTQEEVFLHAQITILVLLVGS